MLLVEDNADDVELTLRALQKNRLDNELVVCRDGEEALEFLFCEGRYAQRYMDALPDFVKLAEAYGHIGLKIERPSEIEPALKELIRLKDRTVFLDVRTDPTENVWPMVQAGAGITDMLLGSEDL